MLDFRSTILIRLKDRDRKCEKFSRVFKAHEELVASFNHVLSTGSVTDEASRVSTDSDGAEPDREKVRAEFVSVSAELADVYKQKAINDQKLIDTNAKVLELDRKIADVMRERDDFLRQIGEERLALSRVGEEVSKFRQDNETLNDECIASEFLLNATRSKMEAAERERGELLRRVEQMQLRNAELTRELAGGGGSSARK